MTARAETPETARSIAEQAPEVSPAELQTREPEAVGVPQASDKFVYYGNEALPPEVCEVISPLYPVEDKAQSGPVRYICGFRRKTFWIVIALAFLILAGGIGGGVSGGIVSTRSKDDKKPGASTKFITTR
jgi:hypothetical protein